MVFFMVIPVDLLGGCRRLVAPGRLLGPEHHKADDATVGETSVRAPMLMSQ